MSQLSKKWVLAELQKAIDADGLEGVKKFMKEHLEDGRVKVTPFEREEIRKRYGRGDSVAHIAAWMGVSEPWIRKILGIGSGSLELDPGLKVYPMDRNRLYRGRPGGR